MKAWRLKTPVIDLGDNKFISGRAAKNLLQALPTPKVPSRLFLALMKRVA